MRAHAVRLPPWRSPSLLALAALARCDDDHRAATSTPTRSTPSSRPSWAPAGCSTPEDVAQPSNATRTVDCAEKHTAETYAVGELPERFEDATYDDAELGAWAYQTCSRSSRSSSAPTRAW